MDMKFPDDFYDYLERIEGLFATASDDDKRHIIDKLDGIKSGIFMCIGDDNPEFKKLDTLFEKLIITKPFN
ncbi:MAG: hypothetical protein ACI9YH_004567 [Colwellia sp.]|jgi:hypothetical protein